MIDWKPYNPFFTSSNKKVREIQYLLKWYDVDKYNKYGIIFGTKEWNDLFNEINHIIGRYYGN